MALDWRTGRDALLAAAPRRGLGVSRNPVFYDEDDVTQDEFVEEYRVQVRAYLKSMGITMPGSVLSPFTPEDQSALRSATLQDVVDLDQRLSVFRPSIDSWVPHDPEMLHVADFLDDQLTQFWGIETAHTADYFHDGQRPDLARGLARRDARRVAEQTGSFHNPGHLRTVLTHSGFQGTVPPVVWEIATSGWRDEATPSQLLTAWTSPELKQWGEARNLLWLVIQDRYTDIDTVGDLDPGDSVENVASIAIDLENHRDENQHVLHLREPVDIDSLGNILGASPGYVELTMGVPGNDELAHQVRVQVAREYATHPQALGPLVDAVLEADGDLSRLNRMALLDYVIDSRPPDIYQPNVLKQDLEDTDHLIAYSQATAHILEPSPVIHHLMNDQQRLREFEQLSVPVGQWAPDSVFVDVTYLQGSDAHPFLDRINDGDLMSVFTELQDYDYGEETTEASLINRGDRSWEPGWGSDDAIQAIRVPGTEDQTYVLTSNWNLEYVSLTRVGDYNDMAAQYGISHPDIQINPWDTQIEQDRLHEETLNQSDHTLTR